jgi:polyisoprenoid-binding protein YceI
MGLRFYPLVEWKGFSMIFARLVSVGVTSAVLVLAAPGMLAQSSTWKADPNHSEVDFSITHLGIANVHGRLGKIDATVVFNDQDVTQSSVKATIHMDGVDTGVAARDNDLKGANFFDVDHFSTATFTSTSVAKGGSGLQVSGNLTIKGVTKPVVLDVEGPKGPVSGMDKKQHVGFEATTTLHRTDFGIAPNMPPAMVGDDVKVTIEMDLAKQ